MQIQFAAASNTNNCKNKCKRKKKKERRGMGKAHADANHKSNAQHNGKDAALRAFAVFSLICGTHAPHTIQLQHTREQPSRFYTHSSSCSVLLCLSAPAITVVPLTPMLLLTRLHTCTETQQDNSKTVS